MNRDIKVVWDTSILLHTSYQNKQLNRVQFYNFFLFQNCYLTAKHNVLEPEK